MSSSEPDMAAERFVDLDALRAQHLALLKAWRTQDSRNESAIAAFRRAVAATGSVLGRSSDRQAAQDILEYWGAQLLSASTTDSLPDLDLELAPYRPAFVINHNPVLKEMPSSQEYEASLPALPEVKANPQKQRPFRQWTRRSTAVERTSALPSSLSPPVATNSAEQIRLSALARQWRQSKYQRGYLLTGIALAEAADYRDKDPEIETFVAASEAAEHRTRLIRIGFGITLFLSLVFAIAATLLHWQLQQQALDNEIRATRFAAAYYGAYREKIENDITTKNIDDIKSLLARANQNLNDVTTNPSLADSDAWKAATKELAAEITRTVTLDAPSKAILQITLTKGQQLQASAVLIDSPSEGQRSKTTKDLIDAFKPGGLLDADQKRVCDELVGMLMHPSVDRLTQTGIKNLLDILSTIPAEKWSDPKWQDTLSGARRAAAWLLRPVTGNVVLDGAARNSYDKLLDNLGPPPPKPGLSVSLRFTGIDKMQAETIGEALAVLGWKVQAPEAGDATSNEIRYGSPADLDAAKALLADLNQYRIPELELAATATSLSPTTLEVRLSSGPPSAD